MSRHPDISSVDEIIAEAQNGRMVILLDDDRPSETADLYIPAQMATPDAIAFMAINGRGLIHLALTPERIAELGLGLISGGDRAPGRDIHAVSIEARIGVTTGISAADRARTITVAIDASLGRDRLVTPGHVFPVVAQPGGVLVRAGHAEASVDLSQLAGLNASGVICKILSKNGDTAGSDYALQLGRQHGLKICSIRDLIAFRQRRDNNLERISERVFSSATGGEWRAIVYRNIVVETEFMALVKGTIDPDRPTLVRMHQINVFTDVLAEVAPRQDLLRRAMSRIAEEGAGVIVLIRKAVGNTYSDDVAAMAEMMVAPADRAGLRGYGAGAQVLTELGIHEMIILSNSEVAPIALAGYDLHIVEQRSI